MADRLGRFYIGLYRPIEPKISGPDNSPSGGGGGAPFGWWLVLSNGMYLTKMNEIHQAVWSQSATLAKLGPMPFSGPITPHWEADASFVKGYAYAQFDRDCSKLAYPYKRARGCKEILQYPLRGKELQMFVFSTRLNCADLARHLIAIKMLLCCSATTHPLNYRCYWNHHLHPRARL